MRKGNSLESRDSIAYAISADHVITVLRINDVIIFVCNDHVIAVLLMTHNFFRNNHVIAILRMT